MNVTICLAIGLYFFIAFLLWPFIACDIDRRRVDKSIIEVSLNESVIWGLVFSMIWFVYMIWRIRAKEPRQQVGLKFV